jgi:hypothetical protein
MIRCSQATRADHSTSLVPNWGVEVSDSSSLTVPARSPSQIIINHPQSVPLPQSQSAGLHLASPLSPAPLLPHDLKLTPISTSAPYLPDPGPPRTTNTQQLSLLRVRSSLSRRAFGGPPTLPRQTLTISLFGVTRVISPSNWLSRRTRCAYSYNHLIPRAGP